MNRKKSKKSLTIIWHGGEPLLWGIENYRRIFEFVEGHSDGLNIKQCVQTNLSLIDADYIRLFQNHKVRVGFSLDGTKDINDKQRLTVDGKGTFDIIMNKVAMCKALGLQVGCILVGSKNFRGRIKDVYDFLCANELNFTFNPLFIAGEAVNAGDAIAISPKEYAEMAIELFDLWYDDKRNRLNESAFVDVASYFVSKTRKSRRCMFAANCQDSFMAVSPSGDVFPCGRFCETSTQYSYGNIARESLESIVDGIKNTEIYARSKYIENGECSKCKYYGLCHGGCLHDGFLNKKDFKSKTFLCQAYKLIFSHIEQRTLPLIQTCH